MPALVLDAVDTNLHDSPDVRFGSKAANIRIPLLALVTSAANATGSLEPSRCAEP
jgi:hypothetical protein